MSEADLGYCYQVVDRKEFLEPNMLDKPIHEIAHTYCTLSVRLVEAADAEYKDGGRQGSP